jgi:hypothetical protein
MSLLLTVVVSGCVAVALAAVIHFAAVNHGRR